MDTLDPGGMPFPDHFSHFFPFPLPLSFGTDFSSSLSSLLFLSSSFGRALLGSFPSCWRTAAAAHSSGASQQPVAHLSLAAAPARLRLRLPCMCAGGDSKSRQSRLREKGIVCCPTNHHQEPSSQVPLGIYLTVLRGIFFSLCDTFYYARLKSMNFLIFHGVCTTYM